MYRQSTYHRQTAPRWTEPSPPETDWRRRPRPQQGSGSRPASQLVREPAAVVGEPWTAVQHQHRPPGTRTLRTRTAPLTALCPAAGQLAAVPGLDDAVRDRHRRGQL